MNRRHDTLKFIRSIKCGQQKEGVCCIKIKRLRLGSDSRQKDNYQLRDTIFLGDLFPNTLWSFVVFKFNPQYKNF